MLRPRPLFIFAEPCNYSQIPRPWLNSTYLFPCRGHVLQLMPTIALVRRLDNSIKQLPIVRFTPENHWRLYPSNFAQSHAHKCIHTRQYQTIPHQSSSKPSTMKDSYLVNVPMSFGITESLLSVTVLLLLLYQYLIYNYNFWRSRGVPGPQPVAFFGTVKSIFMGKDGLGSYSTKIYKEYQNEPLVGIEI